MAMCCHCGRLLVMKETSNTFKVISRKVLGLGRVLEICASENINDVQGFGWSNKPTFHASQGLWLNDRVATTFRANPNRGELSG
jgi:hypothetical protein